MIPVPKKRYTAEFKAQAVGLVELGKSVPDVARDLEISDGGLSGWVGVGSTGAPLGCYGQGVPQTGYAEPAADVLRRLRRENVHLKLENDILKKAAVILGTKPQAGDGR